VATCTVTHRNGNFLIAFLSFFIAFVGTCVWRIISFISHQYDAQDAIYHQCQVIFRNSNTSGAGSHAGPGNDIDLIKPRRSNESFPRYS
jgi:hypothetical protein